MSKRNVCQYLYITYIIFSWIRLNRKLYHFFHLINIIIIYIYSYLKSKYVSYKYSNLLLVDSQLNCLICHPTEQEVISVTTLISLYSFIHSFIPYVKTQLQIRTLPTVWGLHVSLPPPPPSYPSLFFTLSSISVSTSTSNSTMFSTSALG